MQSLDAYVKFADGPWADSWPASERTNPRSLVARWMRTQVPAAAVAFIRSRLPGLAWTLFGGKIERAVMALVDWLAAYVDPATADPKAP